MPENSRNKRLRWRGINRIAYRKVQHVYLKAPEEACVAFNLDQSRILGDPYILFLSSILSLSLQLPPSLFPFLSIPSLLSFSAYVIALCILNLNLGISKFRMDPGHNNEALKICPHHPVFPLLSPALLTFSSSDFSLLTGSCFSHPQLSSISNDSWGKNFISKSILKPNMASLLEYL